LLAYPTTTAKLIRPDKQNKLLSKDKNYKTQKTKKSTKTINMFPSQVSKNLVRRCRLEFLAGWQCVTL